MSNTSGTGACELDAVAVAVADADADADEYWAGAGTTASRFPSSSTQQYR
jgi:hypothetical protein